jgi:hypothetical protein
MQLAKDEKITLALQRKINVSSWPAGRGATIMPAELRSLPPDRLLLTRSATPTVRRKSDWRQWSHKVRDGRLSPRAMLMWLVIMMQPISTSQSQNIPAPS